jgi:hypothetical protein
MTIDALRDEIEHYCGLGERVIDQVRRRVLDGEQVPNAENIRSRPDQARQRARNTCPEPITSCDL